jgi:hypothetical protein
VGDWAIETHVLGGASQSGALGHHFFPAKQSWKQSWIADRGLRRASRTNRYPKSFKKVLPAIARLTNPAMNKGLEAFYS